MIGVWPGSRESQRHKSDGRIQTQLDAIIPKLGQPIPEELLARAMEMEGTRRPTLASINAPSDEDEADCS